MSWNLEFSPGASKAFDQLDKAVQQRIRNYLKARVLPEPRRLGQALGGDKKGLWRYRVGDYRIIVNILDEKITVLVVRVGHRKHVYD